MPQESLRETVPMFPPIEEIEADTEPELLTFPTSEFGLCSCGFLGHPL